MSRRQLGAVIDHLRRGAPDAASDSQLLDHFVSTRDENAFELLVWRHARLVLGVCRRVLAHEADAEDAFQATFLVLVRQARSLRRGDSLASWLARIAYRVALRARAGRPAVSVLTGVDPPSREAEPAVAAAWREVRSLLDQELDSLPEKYRVPLVLCHLEGKTQDEAARELGCPRGTVAVRLMRGRELLRGRLVRRGVVLSAAALVSGLDEAARAASDVLVSQTVRAGLRSAAGEPSWAVSLAEGVVRSMWLNKIKTGAAGVLLAVTVLAGVGLGVQSQVATHAEPPKDPPPPAVVDRKLPADPPPPRPETPPPWKGLLGDPDALALEFEMKQGDQPYKGTIKYQKPDRAAIQVHRGVEEMTDEYVIVDRDAMWILVPKMKTAVRDRDQAGRVPITFALFAPRPEEFWSRFEVSVAKKDDYYHYLNVLPRSEADKKVVTRARLVVNRETLLPRQLWVELPGGDTVTWEIVRAVKDPPLKDGDFQLPDLTGWQIEERPTPARYTAPPAKTVGPTKVEAAGGQVRVQCDLFEATADRFVKDGNQFQFSGKVRLILKGKPGEAPTQVSAEKVIVSENGQLQVEGRGKTSGP